MSLKHREFDCVLSRTRTQNVDVRSYGGSLIGNLCTCKATQRVKFILHRCASALSLLDSGRRVVNTLVNNYAYF